MELRELIKVAISFRDRDKNWRIPARMKVIVAHRGAVFTATAVTSRVTYNPSHTPRVNWLLQPFTGCLPCRFNRIGLQLAWKSSIRLRLHSRGKQPKVKEGVLIEESVLTRSVKSCLRTCERRDVILSRERVTIIYIRIIDFLWNNAKCKRE